MFLMYFYEELLGKKQNTIVFQFVCKNSPKILGKILQIHGELYVETQCKQYFNLFGEKNSPKIYFEKLSKNTWNNPSKIL